MRDRLHAAHGGPLGFAGQGRLVVTLRGTEVLERIPVIERALEAHERILGVTSSDAMLPLDLPAGIFDPVHPFEYRFLDEALNDLHASEQRLVRLIGIFAAISILVACLGLFGLTAFTTERRTKEIGVRKVLGATTAQIVLLLSRRTAALAALGSAVASLVAYAVMRRWLDAFAYRAEMSPGAFVGAAAIVLALALLTVSMQSLKAARARPVRSLRHD